MTELKLSDFKRYFTKVKDGYKATLGYSSINTAQIKLNCGVLIDAPRDLFHKVWMKSFISGSTIYLDSNFNIIDLVDERIKVSK